jgi:cytochrome c oxidase assembly protein subunit 15
MASLPVPSTRASKAVGIWLLLVAALIAAMVTLGGLTRLTGSGLSITEWHPVTGVIPPLGEQAWAAEFEKYRRIPQYRLENPHMDLADFKAIYWWEWSHRMLGRLLGVAFLLPFIFFMATRAIARADLPRMLGLFALGGLQGFVGWWMVMSGLETRVSVSQYRLAIHLGVAIILLGALLWAALDYLQGVFPPPRAGEVSSAARRRGDFPPSPWSLSSGRALRGPGGGTPPASGGRKLSSWSLAFVALVYVQMLLGALVAGLHAGLIYNTWPSMDGRAFPEHPFFDHLWWRNFGDNPGLAQFDHRVGAYAVALGALALWFSGRRAGVTGDARRSSNVLLAITGLQIVLGIVTLLSQAPVALAALHQATAVALYAASVWHAHALRARPMPLSAPVPDPQ